MNTYEFKTRYNHGATALHKQFQKVVGGGIPFLDLQEFITLKKKNDFRAYIPWIS